MGIRNLEAESPLRTEVVRVHYEVDALIKFFERVNVEKPTKEMLEDAARKYGYNKHEKKRLLNYYKEKNRKPLKEYNHNAIYKALNTPNLSEHAHIDSKRVEMAMQHIKSLHFRGGKIGFIVFFHEDEQGNPHQWAIHCNDITEEKVRRLLTLPNIYMTVNISRICRRLLENIWRINALYLDIDNVDAEEYLNREGTKKRYERFHPSLIVRTGRGIQEYYFLENIWAYNNPKMTNLISILQERLLKSVPEADNIKDISRILRLAGSTYIKEGKAAEIGIIYSSDKQWHVSDIRDIFLPSRDNKGKDKSENNSKGKKHVLKNPFSDVKEAKADGKEVKEEKKFYILAFNKQGSQFLCPISERCKTANERRIKDIEKLVELGYIGADYRKRAVFLYCLFIMRETNDAKLARECVFELNKSFTNPLRGSQIKTATNSVLKHKNHYRYNFGSTRLLELFDLTAREDIQAQLQSIRSRHFRDKEHDERRKAKKQEEKEKNSIAKAKEFEKNRYMARDLLAQGLNRSQIQKRLNVSEYKVRKLLSHK